MATGLREVQLGAAAIASFLMVACGHDPQPATPHHVRTHVYKFGDKVRFDAGGDAYRFLGEGWSGGEPSSRWTERKQAVLYADLHPVPIPLQLNIVLAGHTKLPELPSQPVDVSVNGIEAAHWDVGGEVKTYSAPLPRELTAAGGLLTIRFDIPRATSPAAIGGSSDTRLLGLRCLEMRIVRSESAPAR